MKYVIKSGDTLSAIAKRFNTTVKKLQKLNSSITDPDKIRVGQVLTISDEEDITTLIKRCVNEIEQLDSFKKVVSKL